MPDKKKNSNNEDLPKELVACIKEVINQCETADSWVRKQQIKMWKKNDEFWHGIQYIFWSESKQDWIAPSETRWAGDEEGREEADGPFYDYVINIYKAHGESIIAALSAQIPGVRFPPDNAEDEDDILTSKTYSKIAELVQKHNKAKQSLLRALFILWNQGIVASYNAPKSDKTFGMLQVPQYAMGKYCEECQKSVGKVDETEQAPAPGDEGDGEDKGLTEPDSSNLDAPEDPGADACPDCGGPVIERKIITGFSEAPKTRILWDIFGPLHVRIPYYARSQKDCGYINLNIDQPKSVLKEIYDHIEDEIEADYTEVGQFERIARTPSSFSSQNRVDDNRDLATLRRWWLKPWQFNCLGKDKQEEKKKLKKMFPDGCYAAFVGNTYAESRNEDADKHWVIGQSGLSQYIHSDPLGQPLIPVQEMKNVLANLTQETIEHGIPSGFADVETLNFDVYSRHENRPGMMYPVKAAKGQRIADSFYESSRATLSKEVPGFSAQLDQAGQFVVGSFPSIYGGPAEGKSRTAAEYNMSRQMALQRLSITWSFVVDWWSRLIEKSVHMYVENIITDERHTTMENDNYVNVWIRQAELSGKVGDVEAEGSETFPISSPQKQEMLLKLLGLNNDFLNAAIFDPENRSEVADVLAYPDLHIPGEDQRIKQAREIQQMLKGMPVPPEPMVDDDQIHIGVCTHFLVGQLGLDAKVTNPQGYQLVMQHLMMHQQSLQLKTQQPFEATAPGQAPDQGVEA